MLLEARGLTMRFGGLVAVRDLHLRVAAGELVGLIGPNGAGKTTCFNVISGFYPPSAGHVFFEGREITGWKPHRITELGICRTFQVTRPFGHLSVLDNVLVGALCREPNPVRARALAETIVQQVGLVSHRTTLAQGLPVGLRKRLEVARALATRPKLLLLDEVMGGLNPAEVQDMVALIRRLHANGITIVMIEHVMAAVMSLCQRILVLHHGELIAEGTPAQVASDRAVIDAYLGEAYLAQRS